MKRAWILAKAATAERAPYLGRVLPDLLRLSESTVDDEAFKTGVAYWASRVDEIVEPRRVQRHFVGTPG